MFLSFYCIVFPLCVAPTKITIKTLPQCNAVGGAAERSKADGGLKLDTNSTHTEQKS